MTPSSAATTRMTMFVTRARARICVNASWPGVSRKVTSPFGVYAVGADVLRNAASFAGATSDVRILSRRDVLPWSTCPSP
jgi:hypothetical protein